jgi:hypothetical protein
MSFDGLLINVATLKRIGSSKDTYGNLDKTYTTVASNIKCRLNVSTTMENELNRDSIVTEATVFTRYTPVYAKDLLEIAGQIWHVMGDPILRQNSIAGHHYEIPVEKSTL